MTTLAGLSSTGDHEPPLGSQHCLARPLHVTVPLALLPGSHPPLINFTVSEKIIARPCSFSVVRFPDICTHTPHSLPHS